MVKNIHGYYPKREDKPVKGILIDMMVVTDIPLQEFNYAFVEWVESNGWKCKGGMCPCDEDGNPVFNKY